jgi:hypothetical protein
LRARTIEYLKYLVALVAVRLPSIVSAKLFEGAVAQQCPRTR